MAVGDPLRTVSPGTQTLVTLPVSPGARTKLRVYSRRTTFSPEVGLEPAALAVDDPIAMLAMIIPMATIAVPFMCIPKSSAPRSRRPGIVSKESQALQHFIEGSRPPRAEELDWPQRATKYVPLRRFRALPFRTFGDPDWASVQIWFADASAKKAAPMTVYTKLNTPSWR